MDQAKDWRDLCEAAAHEQDSKKLMSLIAEISKALDERGRGRASNHGNDDKHEADFPTLSGAA